MCWLQAARNSLPAVSPDRSSFGKVLEAIKFQGSFIPVKAPGPTVGRNHTPHLVLDFRNLQHSPGPRPSPGLPVERQPAHPRPGPSPSCHASRQAQTRLAAQFPLPASLTLKGTQAFHKKRIRKKIKCFSSYLCRWCLARSAPAVWWGIWQATCLLTHC